MKYKCGKCPIPCYLSFDEKESRIPEQCLYVHGHSNWKEVPDDTPISGASGFPGTLRDWFAGKALAGWLASFAGASYSVKPKDIATEVYQFADAMLAALKKKES